MSIERDPTKGRLAVRRWLRAGLGLVPMPVLVPLRGAYAHAPAGSTRRKVVGTALRAARLRAITGVDEFTLADAPDLHFANVDSQIVQLVYWLGQSGYEPGEAAFWRRACEEAGGILEIGANIGYYTVQGASASRGTRYVAVEPLPANVDALRRNIALNDLKVEVVAAAVVGASDDGNGAEPAPVTLMLPDLHPYAASTGAYVKGASVGDRVATRSATVPAVRSTSLVADGDIDLVKIDIEGFEYEVLAPLRAWLATAVPVLFVEVLDHSQDLRDLLADLVADSALEAWALTGDRPQAIDGETLRHRSLKRDFGTRDVVLAPPERAARLGLPGR
jgi:FkbM family methyltransferase